MVKVPDIIGEYRGYRCREYPHSRYSDVRKDTVNLFKILPDGTEWCIGQSYISSWKETVDWHWEMEEKNGNEEI